MSKELIIELLYPAIVAILASYLSYRATYNVSKEAKEKEKIDQLSNLLDNVLLQFGKLNSVFDALISDIEAFGYFSLINTGKGLKIVNALSGYTWSIHLLEDKELRIKLIEGIDASTTLINQVNDLEKYPFGEEEKAEKKRSAIKRESRQLRARLFTEEIIIGGKKLKAKYTKTSGRVKKSDEKLKAVDAVVAEYSEELKKAEEAIGTLTLRNQKRRPLIATKIVDLKAKIRDLTLSLEKVSTELKNDK